jgi:hypothetical protein
MPPARPRLYIVDGTASTLARSEASEEVQPLEAWVYRRIDLANHPSKALGGGTRQATANRAAAAVREDAPLAQAASLP